jgi:hypothetical protein
VSNPEVHVREDGGSRPITVHRTTVWTYVTCTFIILGAIAASIAVTTHRDDERARQTARAANVAAAGTVAIACGALYSPTFNPRVDAATAAAKRNECWRRNGLDVAAALESARIGKLRAYLEDPRHYRPPTTPTTTKEQNP